MDFKKRHAGCHGSSENGDGEGVVLGRGWLAKARGKMKGVRGRAMGVDWREKVGMGRC